MFLGVHLVLAKSFARIHLDNLVNSGIPPVTFADPKAYDGIQQGTASGSRTSSRQSGTKARRPSENLTRGTRAALRVSLRPYQREVLLAGGGIRYVHLHVPR